MEMEILNYPNVSCGSEVDTRANLADFPRPVSTNGQELPVDAVDSTRGLTGETGRADTLATGRLCPKPVLA